MDRTGDVFHAPYGRAGVPPRGTGRRARGETPRRTAGAGFSKPPRGNSGTWPSQPTVRAVSLGDAAVLLQGVHLVPLLRSVWFLPPTRPVPVVACDRSRTGRPSVLASSRQRRRRRQHINVTDRAPATRLRERRWHSETDGGRNHGDDVSRTGDVFRGPTTEAPAGAAGLSPVGVPTSQPDWPEPSDTRRSRSPLTGTPVLGLRARPPGRTGRRCDPPGTLRSSFRAFTSCPCYGAFGFCPQPAPSRASGLEQVVRMLSPSQPHC